MSPYVTLEVRRVLRNPISLVMTMIVPIFMYLLFSNTVGGPGADPVDVKRAILGSMTAYGAIGAALFATGPRIAEERSIGWMRQLRATPLPGWTALTAKVLAALLLSLLAALVVGAVGFVTGAELPFGRWLLLVVAMVVASIAFGALGVLFGAAFRKPDSALQATLLTYLFMAAIGGLWVPLDSFPDWLASISSVLPTNHAGVIARAIIDGGQVSATNVLVIGAWTVAATALATVAWRRGTARR